MNMETQTEYEVELKGFEKDPVFIAEGLKLEVMESVCLRLKELHMSRSEFAKKLGKTPAMVTKLLSGENNFTLETLVKVSLVLGVNVKVRLESFSVKSSDEGWDTLKVKHPPEERKSPEPWCQAA